MDLDLAFHALEDGMTRAFLGAVLGTHRLLGGLDRAVRPASILRDVSRLVTALRAGFTDDATASGAVHVCLRDLWGTKANLGSSSDDLAGCYESLSDTLADRRIDGLLLDYGGLVTGSHVLLANGTDAAAWIRAKVFNLTDVTATALSSSFHIVQNYALNVTTCIVGSAAFMPSNLDKRVLRDEKAAAVLAVRSLGDLLELREATLVSSRGGLLLYPGATARLPPQRFVGIIDKDLMDFISGGIRWVERLGSALR